MSGSLQFHDRRHERREGNTGSVVGFLEFFLWEVIFSIKKSAIQIIVRIWDKENCVIIPFL